MFTLAQDVLVGDGSPPAASRVGSSASFAERLRQTNGGGGGHAAADAGRRPHGALEATFTAGDARPAKRREAGAGGGRFRPRGAAIARPAAGRGGGKGKGRR